MELLDKQGKSFLVYIDAEFQAFRQPDDDAHDELKKLGYVASPYEWGMKKMNIGTRIYHFLLSLGFIVMHEGQPAYYFADFPSLFDSKSPAFSNGMLLEPAYTTCKPDIAEKIAGLRWVDDAGIFPSYQSLDAPKQLLFQKINQVYNSGINEVEHFHSYGTLTFFFQYVVPTSLLVHKGSNDLRALRNSAQYYGLPLGEMTTRDLDRIDYKRLLPGLKGIGLPVIQEYFVTTDARLLALREALLADVRAFFIQKWGPTAADVASHNPLVDCVYTAVVDLGISRV